MIWRKSKMSFIVSLQGGMAVGKTTLVYKLKERHPDVYFLFENPNPVINEVKRRNLNKFIEEDYIEIQRMFISYEIDRYKSIESRRAIIDLGPEEVEFYNTFSNIDWTGLEC